MLSIPIVHHVYSSVGGYKTVYVTQDPAAQRIQKALVSVANVAYKGGMGATFRGWLRFQLPVPPVPRPTLTPWQLPATVALGNGRWYLKSFPMGTDHVGRPRACVHSMVILPERLSPPAWWQPQTLSQVESAIVSNYDFPADQLFLHGRDSLQGLRERTRNQYPWQPQETLNRAAGLEWLVAGNLPPALIGSMLKLLLFPGARLFLLASEEHALFLARQLECVLPGSYRRHGGFLLGPHQRFIVPPLCPPNLIQIARPAEYPQGECLVDLTSAPPRWIGPEPPTSPLAAQVLDYLNRRDLAGLLRFIEMWDMFDELAPTPSRQTGGLTALTSLKLLSAERASQPLPDWTADAAACAAALPFLIQAGWLSAHDAAWQSVRAALARHGTPAAAAEIGVWETYVQQVHARPNTAPPPAPAIRGIVQALEAPSHSAIIAAIDDSMLDDSWMDDSSHKIPVIHPNEDGEAGGPSDFAMPPSARSPLEDTYLALPNPGGEETDAEAQIEPGTMEIDAEFALPGIGAGSGHKLPTAEDAAAEETDETVPAELETVAEDWAAQAAAQAALTESAKQAAPRQPMRPKVSSALESASSAALPTVDESGKSPSSLRLSTPMPTPPPASAKGGGQDAADRPAPANGEVNDSATLIGALEGDTTESTGTASSSVLLVAEEDTTDTDPATDAPRPAHKPPPKPPAKPAGKPDHGGRDSKKFKRK